ncbi:MAG: diguanylate cyclase [Deltaproteobacteria bacterium]|nr:diguanylate cyclase [Deltaproteobacteria bacterium]
MNEDQQPAELSILLVTDDPRKEGVIRRMLSRYQWLKLILHKNSQLLPGPDLFSICRHDAIIFYFTEACSEHEKNLKRISAIIPAVPIIIILQKAPAATALRLIREGAHECLDKQHLTGRELARILQHAVVKRRVDEQAKKTIENKIRKLQDLSIKDGLTGLHNHRHMKRILSEEFARAKRYGVNLTCLLIDIDFFKSINDIYGHEFGDYVLKKFSTQLQKCVRMYDICCRYGGDEFCVFLPNTGLNGARKLAQKIQLLFANTTFRQGNFQAAITVSIGIGSLRTHKPQQARELLSLTDRALYQAKASGRNTVITFANNQQANMPAKPDQLLRVATGSPASSLHAATALSLCHLRAPRQKEVDRTLNCLELIADKINFPPYVTDTYKRAARLHGRLKDLLPAAIMQKQAALTPEETILIRKHPNAVAEFIDIFDFFAQEKEILLCHHERYDGEGYPRGLKAYEIPFGARVFAVVDAFVAMTSDRPYRTPLSAQQTLQELIVNAGKQFDPMVINIFLDIISENNLLSVTEDIVQEAKKRLPLPAISSELGTWS